MSTQTITPQLHQMILEDLADPSDAPPMMHRYEMRIGLTDLVGVTADVTVEARSEAEAIELAKRGCWDDYSEHRTWDAETADMPIDVEDVKLVETCVGEVENDEYLERVLADPPLGHKAPDPFAEFGKAVLRIMTTHEDWSADTLDAIAEAAKDVPGMQDHCEFTWTDPVNTEGGR